jgi:DNA mismatch endonuclease (patch repair protein)
MAKSKEGTDRRGLITTPERSRLMAGVRRKGTAPERVVRAILARQGYKVKRNSRGLPGSPDLLDVANRRAVFVHGCFWHRHKGCSATTTPKQNGEFWEEKFEKNTSRDRRNVRRLRGLGYRVLTVWECQTKNATKLARLEQRLARFFGAPS